MSEHVIDVIFRNRILITFTYTFYVSVADCPAVAGLNIFIQTQT